MRLLIGIPIYNERKSVDRVLAEVLAHGHDVLLVDDASTDGTAEYLATRRDVALIRHDRNRGYGQGIIDIFDYADRCGYEWVITMDCDEQHEPARIPDFVWPPSGSNRMGPRSAAVAVLARPTTG